MRLRGPLARPLLFQQHATKHPLSTLGQCRHSRLRTQWFVGTISVVTKELGYHEADADPRVEALRSIYGVGLITSMTLVAEIGDISRFPTARKLCAWAGLTPSVHNSDVKVRHGHITKAGPAAVRAVLTEASYQARHVTPFAKFFEEVAKRRGKRIATVALSRKILARCFRVLKGLETPA